VAALSELESSAQHLRACLSRTQGLHALLCGLQFFAWLNERTVSGAHATFVEASLREFVPDLAAAARLTRPDDLLPDEIKKLQELIALIRAMPGIVSSDDLATFETLEKRSESSHSLEPPPAADDDQVVLAGLFVEHHPELRLAPRGRLLWLRVEAEERRRGKTDDQAVLLNTTIRPDDEFRRQADHAVRLAREYLTSKHALNPKKRFRVDFEVEGVTSSLTGPSLGLALAVGAAVAMARRAILRDTLDVPSDVAFSGALSPDGRLVSIDGEGLRLKLTRAIHSGLRHVVVPRAHITEAWDFVRQHPPADPKNSLNLVAADDLATILGDRNLVFPQKRSQTAFQFLRFRKRMREPRVGIPILLALLLILAWQTVPWLAAIIDRNPASVTWEANTFVVRNRHGIALWSKTFDCDSLLGGPYCVIEDLDGDGRAEVAVAPRPYSISQLPARVHAYASPGLSLSGTLLWERNCSIWGEYPQDSTPGLAYGVQLVDCKRLNGTAVIVTSVAQQNPARSHVRFWSPEGDSVGWYICAGGGVTCATFDYGHDGREELMLLSYNNRAGCVGLAVLNPAGSVGASPPYSDALYDLSRVRQGNQLRYMIFPKSDASTADNPLYNRPWKLEQESSKLMRVDVCEGSPDSCTYCSVSYYLDDSLRVKKVDVNDPFKAHREQMVKDGRLPAIDWPEYFQSLRDSILHWTPTGWTH